jgi:hypothetical protein
LRAGQKDINDMSLIKEYIQHVIREL